MPAATGALKALRQAARAGVPYLAASAGACLACPTIRTANLEQRREEVRRGMAESVRLLDGSLASSVSMLTGLSPERIEELGGAGDWED